MNRLVLTKYTLTSLVFLLLWGCQSDTRWKFDRLIHLTGVAPVGIAIDQNALWISDVQNNRVIKLGRDGKIIQSHDGFQRPMHLAVYRAKVYVPEYLTDTISVIDGDTTSNLRLSEQLDAPGSVAIAENTIAVADFYNHRIILQHNGQTTTIGYEGHGPGELYYPTDVDLAQGMVYVADAYNNRVQVFDTDGNILRIVGERDSIQVATGLVVNQEKIYVTDFEGNRVLVYLQDSLLDQIITDSLSSPTDIAIAEGFMYVANYESKTIAVFKEQ